MSKSNNTKSSKKISTSNEKASSRNVEVEESRGRPGDFRIAQAPERGGVRYVRRQKTQIPKEIQDAFAESGWHLRFITFELNGKEDTHNLSRRINDDGYVFVMKSELPEWYLNNLEERVLTRKREDALIMGDTVLMKTPTKVANARREYYANETSHQVNAVNRNIKGGKFVDQGTKSTYSHKEPSFDG